MRKIKRIIRTILIFLLLLAGIGILLYPDFMDWQESRQHIGFFQEYNENVSLMAAAELEEQFERARIFNEGITDISVNDPWGEGPNDTLGTEEYYTMLNFNHSNRMMARIEIPAIRVDLPIFHGSSSAVLDRGVGHMPHTSLPIGGYGNHAILTAHTGLVSMRLFTDLVHLPIGEVFVITVGNRRLAYEVVERHYVLPHEIDRLVSYEDRDLVTLVTCYPYGHNTHRLLVIGERIYYHEDLLTDIEEVIVMLNVRHLAVIGMLAMLIIVSLFRWIKVLKKRRRDELDEDALDLKHEKEYNEMFGG